MPTIVFPEGDDIDIQGDLRVRGSFLEDIPRSELAQEANAEYVIPMGSWRVWDAHQTLIGTAGADDLGLVTGTLGTNFPSIQTGNLGSAGATTRYAATTVHLPECYDAGETILMRFSAGMLTSNADNSATLDLQCYPNDGDTTVSADICATAAQDINSGTADVFSNFDFTITATSRNPGDELHLRVAIAVNDAANPTVAGGIGKASLLLDIKG